MPTPHLAARPGDIAPLVLMPGDPRRAERIAAIALSDARMVSDIRGVQVWTGEHGSEPMSVMASGMGVPSMSLYATELFAEYDVRRVCRVGTCGAISADVEVADVVLANAAHTNSAVATFPVPGVSLSLAASHAMLAGAVAEASRKGLSAHVGAVYTSDFFYSERGDVTEGLRRWGVLAVEMEAAGLYACAARAGREALAVLTVSDHLSDGSQDLSARQRETQFADAVSLGVAALLA